MIVLFVVCSLYCYSIFCMVHVHYCFTQVALHFIASINWYLRLLSLTLAILICLHTLINKNALSSCGCVTGLLPLFFHSTLSFIMNIMQLILCHCVFCVWNDQIFLCKMTRLGVKYDICLMMDSSVSLGVNTNEWKVKKPCLACKIKHVWIEISKHWIFQVWLQKTYFHSVLFKEKYTLVICIWLCNKGICGKKNIKYHLSS